VIAVEKANPGNVIEVTRFVILSDHLIDAFFEFGAANAGKTFLIYAVGPNGTSRNLTALPQGAPTGCPTGNEQGIQVGFTCARAAPPPPGPGPASFATINECRLERSPTGALSLVISGSRFKPGATLTVGGETPKKMKFKNAEPNEPGAFRTVVAKGRVCDGLPGALVITNPGESPSTPVQCNVSCTTALSAREESVTATREAPATPIEPPPIVDMAVVNTCQLERSNTGVFRLVITGQNFALDAAVQIGVTTFGKLKFQDPDPAVFSRFRRIVVKGKVCKVMPGPIVVTNAAPPSRPSLAFQCNLSCN
jgi:hypothetical protein